MARPASRRLQGLVTVSGMVAFIGALAIAPRISISKTDDATIIKYNHLQPKHSTPAPADPGLVITPSPRPKLAGRTSGKSKGRKPFSQDDWIFDTGATTHVCTNRALLHSYDTLNPYNRSVNPRAVGYFGPNPVPIVGAGDCTFILPALSGDSATAAAAAVPQATGSSSMMQNLLGTGRGRSDIHHTSINAEEDDGNQRADLNASDHVPHAPYRAVTRLTVKNVMHIPEAGVNLISWSQLKRAKGLDLRLVEENDGSLTVREHGRPLMRFEPRDGLFYLVQADLSPAAKQEIVNAH